METAWWERDYKTEFIDKLMAESKYAWHHAAIRARGQCEYCEIDLSSDARWLATYEGDHLWPESRGGKDDEFNVVFACHVCNSLKHNWAASHWVGPPKNSEERKQMIKDAKDHICSRMNQAPTTLGQPPHCHRLLQLAILSERSK
jgi:hypothetical protein